MLPYIKVYKDFIDIVRELDNGARGRLFMAILQYANDEEVDNLTGADKIAFLTMKSQIDRDRDAYAETSAKRKAAGKAGAERRWGHQDIANAILPMANDSKNGICYKDKDKEEDKDNSFFDDGDGNAREFAKTAIEECRYDLQPIPREYQDQAAALANELMTRYSSRAVTQVDISNVFFASFSRVGCGYAYDKDKLELLTYAMQSAADAGQGGNWNYIFGVKRRMNTRGIKTADDADDYDWERVGRL